MRWSRIWPSHSSLASADFDEDGVPDLVSGFAYNGQGIVTLLRGNVDSIYPNAAGPNNGKPRATFTNAPFLSPANVFAAPSPQTLSVRAISTAIVIGT